MLCAKIITDIRRCRCEWFLSSSFLLHLVRFLRLFSGCNLLLEFGYFQLLRTLRFLLFLLAPVGLFLFLTLTFDGSLSEADQGEVAREVLGSGFASDRNTTREKTLKLENT